MEHHGKVNPIPASYSIKFWPLKWQINVINLMAFIAHIQREN